MEHPYQLVIQRADHGHRYYKIIRAEELAFEHYTDESLDIFFRRLIKYLNRADPDLTALEDQIINLKITNKSLMNLIRIALRKLLWCARRISHPETRDYGLAFHTKFVEAADELNKEVFIDGSNRPEDRPAGDDSHDDGVHFEEQEFPDPY